MDHAINEPGHGNNVADGLNGTKNYYLKEKMELLGKLSSNDTSNIAILSIEPKRDSIKTPKQYLQIITGNYWVNGLKGSTKMQKSESLLNFQ